MMPEWWSDTLTLYRRVKTVTDGKTLISWQREVLENCFLGVTKKQFFDGQHIIQQPSFIVRIPATYDIFAKGDIILKGEIADATPDKTSENAFVINVVKDNSKMRNAHYYGGEA